MTGNHLDRSALPWLGSELVKVLGRMLDRARQLQESGEACRCRDIARAVWLEAAGREAALAARAIELLGRSEDYFAETLMTYETMPAEAYERRTSTIAPSLAVNRDRFLRRLPQGRIVDAGAGVGRDMLFFARQGRSVVGIEPCQNFARSLERVGSGVPNFVVLGQDMRCTSLERASVAGIWCCGAFHHIPRKDAPTVLRSFYGLLGPGGVVGMSVKRGSGCVATNRNSVEGLRYYERYDSEELTHLLESAGFSDIEVCEEDATWLFAMAVKEFNDYSTSCDCRFCEIVLGIRHQLDNNRALSTVLRSPARLGGSHTVIIPDGAPICVGHALVVARQHDNGFASAMPDVRKEAVNVLSALGRVLKTSADSTVWYLEHGGAPNVHGPSCVAHSHIHVLPTSSDVRRFLPQAAALRSYPDLNSAWDAVTMKGEYHILGQLDGPALVVGKAPCSSQFLRQVVAVAVGSPHRWNAHDADAREQPQAAIDALHTWERIATCQEL